MFDCVLCMLAGFCTLCSPDIGASEPGRPMTKAETDQAMQHILQEMLDEAERLEPESPLQHSAEARGLDHIRFSGGIGKRTYPGLLSNILRASPNDGETILNSDSVRKTGKADYLTFLYGSDRNENDGGFSGEKNFRLKRLRRVENIVKRIVNEPTEWLSQPNT